MENTTADYVEFASGCSGRLFRTAYLLTGNWHLAEDLVQETLGKVYRSWRRVSRAEQRPPSTKPHAAPHPTFDPPPASESTVTRHVL